ncbi:hypothetical protein [Bradyrhizobium ottawaense]
MAILSALLCESLYGGLRLKVDFLIVNLSVKSRLKIQAPLG